MESREMEGKCRRRWRRGIESGCRGERVGNIGREEVGGDRWRIVNRKKMRLRLKKCEKGTERGNRKRVEKAVVREVEAVALSGMMLSEWSSQMEMFRKVPDERGWLREDEEVEVQSVRIRLELG